MDSKKVLRQIGSIKIAVVCLFLLFVLTFWGTLYQVDYGLWLAQEKFFFSWVFLTFGFIPFPGAKLVMTVMTVNMLADNYLKFKRRLRQPGLLLIHVGILILLIGSFITHTIAKESNMALLEGQTRNFTESYRENELAVWEYLGENQEVEVHAFDATALKVGEKVEFKELGIHVVPRQFYKNANQAPGATSLMNASGITGLTSVQIDNDPQRNLPGGVFEVHHKQTKLADVLLWGAERVPLILNIDGKKIAFKIQRKRFPLPFKIKLDDFRKITYPGETKPKSFESDVVLKNENVDRKVKIFMNNPLRVQDYTFYQASYDPNAKGREMTVLAVVKNASWLLPYISSSIVFLGLCWHFTRMLLLRLGVIGLVFFTLGNVDLIAQSKKDIDISSMAGIRVLDEGRVKPLDTLARTSLLRYNARSTYKSEEGKGEALAWFANVFFNPDSTREDKVFKINNDEVLHAMGVTPEKNHRYSFKQMERGLQALSKTANAAMKKESKDQSPFEKEAIRILMNLDHYFKHSQAFFFSIPLFEVSEAGAKTLGLEGGKEKYTFIDFVQVSDAILAQKAILQGKENLDQLEKEMQSWVSVYDRFPTAFAEAPAKILPSSQGHDGNWFSPWQVFMVEKGEGVLSAEIGWLNSLVESYRTGDQEKFDEAATKIISLQDERLGDDLSSFRNKAELFYNKVDPFYQAKVLLVFAVIAAFASLLIFELPLRRLGLGLMALALAFELFGIAIRMSITGRPPITNLFETFIFVSTIGVIMGFIIEFFHRKGLGLISGSMMGLVLLMISGKFVSEGDTMAVLQAVLRSNFWLSTHVIAINLGYAGVVLAGVVGHVHLVQMLGKGASEQKLSSVAKMVYGTLAFGLIWTLTGTVLGGIWADQSWGRFWGWDPKENGALLIVIWAAILFHARMGGMIGDTLFSAGSAIGIIVVMLAWFGINLLGVGLHSYGFTDGIFLGLVIYIAAQLVFLWVVFLLLFKKKVNFS